MEGFPKIGDPNIALKIVGSLLEGVQNKVPLSFGNSQIGLLTFLFSRDEVLRERDVLEQQTTCWACEGWCDGR